MKNTVRITALLVSVAACFSACDKNDTGQPPVTQTIPKIKTGSNQSGFSTTYTYDAQGRIQKEEYSSGDRAEYIYSANLCTNKYYGSSGNLINELLFELNSSGVAIKEYSASTPSNAQLYEYDSKKRNIRQTYTWANGDVSETRYYYSASDDLDSLVRKTTSNTGTLISHQKEIYEYTGNQSNTTAYPNYGYFFMGYGSTRVPSKRTSINVLSGSQGFVTYSYEYDAQGRITKATGTSHTGAVTWSAFTYY